MKYEPVDTDLPGQIIIVRKSKSSFRESPLFQVGLGGVLLFGIGASMHFVYEFSGCNIIAAVFCAVNESVYEHIKIMLFPILAWWALQAPWDGGLSLSSGTAAMYTALLLLLIGNACLSEAESLEADITVFGACIYAGQAAGAYARFKRIMIPCYQIFLLLVVVMLFTCTFIPSRLPYIFEDHRNHTYGRPEACP
jgi:hypothetical protein